MNMVYRRKNYAIYDAGSHFIVHNMNLKFEGHHTHITRYNTCRYIIDLAFHKTVPKHLSDYLLVSLMKISDDADYIDKIERMLNNSNNKRHYKYKGKVNSKNDKNKRSN